MIASETTRNQSKALMDADAPDQSPVETVTQSVLAGDQVVAVMAADRAARARFLEALSCDLARNSARIIRIDGPDDEPFTLKHAMRQVVGDGPSAGGINPVEQFFDALTVPHGDERHLVLIIDGADQLAEDLLSYLRLVTSTFVIGPVQLQIVLIGRRAISGGLMTDTVATQVVVRPTAPIAVPLTLWQEDRTALGDTPTAPTAPASRESVPTDPAIDAAEEAPPFVALTPCDDPVIASPEEPEAAPPPSEPPRDTAAMAGAETSDAGMAEPGTAQDVATEHAAVEPEPETRIDIQAEAPPLLAQTADPVASAPSPPNEASPDDAIARPPADPETTTRTGAPAEALRLRAQGTDPAAFAPAPPKLVLVNTQPSPSPRPRVAVASGIGAAPAPMRPTNQSRAGGETGRWIAVIIGLVIAIGAAATWQYHNRANGDSVRGETAELSGDPPSAATPEPPGDTATQPSTPLPASVGLGTADAQPGQEDAPTRQPQAANVGTPRTVDAVVAPGSQPSVSPADPTPVATQPHSPPTATPDERVATQPGTTQPSANQTSQAPLGQGQATVPAPTDIAPKPRDPVAATALDQETPRTAEQDAVVQPKPQPAAPTAIREPVPEGPSVKVPVAQEPVAEAPVAGPPLAADPAKDPAGEPSGVAPQPALTRLPPDAPVARAEPDPAQAASAPPEPTRATPTPPEPPPAPPRLTEDGNDKAGGPGGQKAETAAPPTPPARSAPTTATQPLPARPAPNTAAQSPPASTRVSPEVLQLLLARGDELLILGDIASARPIYERAAAAGSAQAARVVGMTYDPGFQAQIGARGMVADPVAAATWYRKAIALGDDQANRLLTQLEAIRPAR